MPFLGQAAEFSIRFGLFDWGTLSEQCVPSIGGFSRLAYGYPDHSRGRDDTEVTTGFRETCKRSGARSSKNWLHLEFWPQPAPPISPLSL